MGALPKPRGALVIGGDYRALGVARSLGRRGVPVWVLAEPGEPLAAVSRFARRSVRWPSGRRDPEFLCELAARHDLRGWALIPSADGSAAMLARAHEQLAAHYTHTTPPWEMLRWTYDKRLTYELAERIGVPCPRSVPAPAAVGGRAAEVTFPAVLKPAIKESANALTTAKAWRVEDAADLERRYLEASEFVDGATLVVQELIGGGGEGQLSYAALCDDGVPLASLTARRTRQYPADFGRASTFVETIDCDEAVEPALALLAEIRYSGLIEVEYKRDPRDGVLKVLDMNPRVWGWHTLCGRAGVDFPWLVWLRARGERLPEVRARPGVRWRRFTTDTPTAVKEVLAGRLGVREYGRSLRGPQESAIFAWDDPLPGVVEVPVLAYMAARRILQGEAV